MAISQHLLHKLRETLGFEAAEDLVNSIRQSDSLSAEVGELRHEMQLGFARVDARLDKLKSDLETLIERRSSDLIKWSFVFWVSAVLSVAVLAGVLK